MLQIAVTNQLDALLLNERTNPRADQRAEFMLKFVERRVGVKLRITGRQSGKEPDEVILVHPSILQQPENSRGVFDPEPTEHGPRPRSQQSEHQGVARPVEEMARSQPQIQAEKIARQAEMRDVPVARALHQDAEDGRVQVKMEMAVHVVEREAGREEFTQLGFDFAFDLRAQALLEKISEAGCDRVIAEISSAIDQARDFPRLERGPGEDQTQVESDAQSWILQRQFNRLVRRRA